MDGTSIMPNTDFLQELKQSFDYVMKSKERIEDKGGNIVSTSATIVTLLLGFGVLLFGSLLPEYNFRLYALVVLALGTAASLIAMVFGIFVAYKRTQYRFAMTHGIFFKEDGTLDESMVNKFKNATANAFSDLMINEYLKSIKDNVSQNAKSAKRLQTAQFLLLLSVIMIAFLIGVLIDATVSGKLDFNFIV